MYFGAHVSVAGGLTRAVEYATSVGCECIQVFAKSPRQWNGPPTDRDKAAAFREACTRANLRGVFSHTAYLINLAAADPGLYEKSVRALADELHRGALLGVDGVVTHIGASSDGDRDAITTRVAEGVQNAIELSDAMGGAARLLLENTAGAGSTFGSSFAEIGTVIASTALPPERLGVCIDTCHAFAFGYSLDSASGWETAVSELRECVGLDRIGLLHVNDCKFERGSHKDRHEWIGDGHIGRAGFSAMVCVSELSGVCGVTEMPGEAPEKDRINVARLTELLEECAPGA